MKSKIISVLLILLLLYSVSGCQKSEEIESAIELIEIEQKKIESKEQILHLSYNAKETLNPYTTTSLQNKTLTTLIYDSLIKMDYESNVEFCLADTIQTEGKSYIIQIKQGIPFSDGSNLTANDVLISLNSAKRSSNYQEQLKNVKSVSTTRDGAIKIDLVENDTYFVQCLDFPITKSGTETKKIPIGTGRYYYENEKLIRNEQYWGEKSKYQTIELINLESQKDIIFSVMRSEIDIGYSDLQENIDFGLSMGHVPVNLNNLIYIGINNSRLNLSTETKIILSECINREELASIIYKGYATGTTGLINPQTEDVQYKKYADEEIISLLEILGYTEIDSNGYRMKSGKTISLRLLVNEENSQKVNLAKKIQEQFKQKGIQLTIEEFPYNTYINNIATGNYQLYLGETEITSNYGFDILLKESSLSVGMQTSETVMKAYQDFRDGLLSPTEFDEIFQTDPTIIPLLYRKGVVCYRTGFSNNIVATNKDIFYNIQNW